MLFYLLLLLAASAAALLFYRSEAKKHRQAYQRLLATSERLDQELTQIQSLQGQMIAQSQVLQLRSNELKRLMPSLHKELKNLRVKPSRALQISQHAFKAQPAQKQEVALRDSVVYDTVPVKVFHYQDPYFNLRGMARDSVQELQMSFQDTLVQVVYRGRRKRPWLWIFSPRQLMQRVHLKNPHAQVYYSQNIQVQK